MENIYFFIVRKMELKKKKFFSRAIFFLFPSSRPSFIAFHALFLVSLLQLPSRSLAHIFTFNIFFSLFSFTCSLPLSLFISLSLCLADNFTLFYFSVCFASLCRLSPAAIFLLLFTIIPLIYMYPNFFSCYFILFFISSVQVLHYFFNFFPILHVSPCFLIKHTAKNNSLFFFFNH